jgi:hypothetical protein
MLRPYLLAALLVPCAVSAAEPRQLDVYVSTGDNHFLGSSLPIDSPASIEATFDLFRDFQHARRIYWRGLEEATWIATMHARPENPRYYSLWEWMQELYKTVQPDQLAVKAAHARGMEIWGVGTMFDWGAPADTPTFGDYPFPFESKLKLAHPEWAPVDKYGSRRQGGPIELAYPEARKALVELHVAETLKAGYDGITFLTYAENYSMRFQDEFGFSEPIVRDFQKLHRIDLRTQPFQRAASREDWLRLRGSYVTAYLRELRAALQPHGKKLGVIINGNDMHAPLAWNVPELMQTAGSQQMDVETWVREGLVDSLLVYGNCAPGAQRKTIEDLLFLCRQTGVEVSFMTSSPLGEHWKTMHERGVPAVLAVSDDPQHTSRGFVPEVGADALGSKQLPQRLRALGEIAEGKLTAPAAQVVPLAVSANMIERRMALRALGKMKAPETLECAVRGLQDPENGVRCAAALALGDLQDGRSVPALFQAVEKHGNHMLVECAVIALRRLKPFPAAELGTYAVANPGPRVQEAAVRALLPFADDVPVLQAASADESRFTRVAAAEALGNVRRAPEVLPLLFTALDHSDPAVAARAAVSLGVIALRNESAFSAQRPAMLGKLAPAFARYGSAEQRADADWGYRPVGNALRAFGEEGAARLRAMRDQKTDPRLAEIAWRVLDLHQQPNTFSETAPREDEEAHARCPVQWDAEGRAVFRTAASPATQIGRIGPIGPISPPTTGRDLHVDPTAGNDASDGIAGPVKTIARALKLAQAGDTVHLAPVRYKEVAIFANKVGEPGRPIILDGHGATLDGADPLKPEEWQLVSPGLYRNDHLLRMDPAILMRWFFVFDGKMNHMGRTSKGTSAELKKPSDLAPGEWTFVPAAPITRETKDGKPWDAALVQGAFFIKLDPAKTLADAHIEAPMRSAGVSFGGKCAHLVIRNVIATHVYNDGFNIHGDQRDLVFENITAIDCGDDGFSAHESAECRIDGFTSIGNSTGFCDVGTSSTHYKNVFIRGCLGYDVFFTSHGTHSLENALVESSAARAVSVGRDGAGEGTCTVRFQNVLVRRAAGAKPQEFRISAGAKLELERCTFENLAVQATPGSDVSIRRSIVTGDPKPDLTIFKDVAWRGEGNLYDVRSLRVDKTPFTAATFAEFQKLFGSESASRWSAAEPRPDGAGADTAGLSKLAKP